MAGIGGLLLLDRSTTQQWVVGSDGRGNVSTLLDALATDTGTPANNLKAGIEYPPYGEVVRSQGSFTEVPFRFQSKWALGQAWEGSWSVEFLDFGRRMYSPSLGRFLSRDPAGEAAGANLYHYCGNDPHQRDGPAGVGTKRKSKGTLRKPKWNCRRHLDGTFIHPQLSGAARTTRGRDLDSVWKIDRWWHDMDLESVASPPGRYRFPLLQPWRWWGAKPAFRGIQRVKQWQQSENRSSRQQRKGLQCVGCPPQGFHRGWPGLQ